MAQQQAQQNVGRCRRLHCQQDNAAKCATYFSITRCNRNMQHAACSMQQAPSHRHNGPLGPVSGWVHLAELQLLFPHTHALSTREQFHLSHLFHPPVPPARPTVCTQVSGSCRRKWVKACAACLKTNRAPFMPLSAFGQKQMPSSFTLNASDYSERCQPKASYTEHISQNSQLISHNLRAFSFSAN